jgi:hypothetical protein
MFAGINAADMGNFFTPFLRRRSNGFACKIMLSELPFTGQKTQKKFVRVVLFCKNF